MNIYILVIVLTGLSMGCWNQSQTLFYTLGGPDDPDAARIDDDVDFDAAATDSRLDTGDSGPTCTPRCGAERGPAALCGVQPDGCGGTIDCGPCEPLQCGPAPKRFIEERVSIRLLRRAGPHLVWREGNGAYNLMRARIDTYDFSEVVGGKQIADIEVTDEGTIYVAGGENAGDGLRWTEPQSRGLVRYAGSRGTAFIELGSPDTIFWAQKTEDQRYRIQYLNRLTSNNQVLLSGLEQVAGLWAEAMQVAWPSHQTRDETAFFEASSQSPASPIVVWNSEGRAQMWTRWNDEFYWWVLDDSKDWTLKFWRSGQSAAQTIDRPTEIPSSAIAEIAVGADYVFYSTGFELRAWNKRSGDVEVIAQLNAMIYSVAADSECIFVGTQRPRSTKGDILYVRRPDAR